MARLSELVRTTSRALRFEERSVILCARYLREAGLISQGGRGPSAAHMQPSDATNLLLGIMASDTIKDAPKSEKLAREASFIGGETNLSGVVETDPPPCPFLKDETGPRSLGAALDALFDEIVTYGDPKTDAGEPITNFRLLVRRPGIYEEMNIDDSDVYYTTRYHRTDPRLDNLAGAALRSAAAKISREQQTAMKTLSEIGLEPIQAIADTLRGFQPKEGEEVRPLYLDADTEADV